MAGNVTHYTSRVKQLRTIAYLQLAWRACFRTIGGPRSANYWYRINWFNFLYTVCFNLISAHTRMIRMHVWFGSPAICSHLNYMITAQLPRRNPGGSEMSLCHSTRSGSFLQLRCTTKTMQAWDSFSFSFRETLLESDPNPDPNWTDVRKKFADAVGQSQMPDPKTNFPRLARSSTFGCKCA